MNTAHVQASFYLLFDTVLNMEEFTNKCNSENVVGSEVSITLPDGSTIKATLAIMEESKVVEFEDNNLEDKEKATKQIA